MDHESAFAVHQAARRAARSADAPMLLAVSGGSDSMALLVAMAAVARAHISAVATFDHGTGPAAREAAAHVSRVCGSLGLGVLVGHMPADAAAPDGWEAAWRAARWNFLNDAAASGGSRVVTAHTEDDQVETVLMRVLRGSGARGLAGLAAASPVVRPFLGLRRADLQRYLLDAGVAWVEDPGNASPAHLRNRVRHDLLPALRRVDGSIDASLLATGRAAARWRQELEALVDVSIRPTLDPSGGLSVASEELAEYDRDSLAVIWGALAGRVGLALDRRGTDRLASFIMKRPVRGSMPLSGGWSLEARARSYRLRRRSMDGPRIAARLEPAETVEWGAFRFRTGETGRGDSAASSWMAWLPADCGLHVRAWAAGDRLLPAAGQPRRRVARYLSEAGLRGSDRAAWPVVVTGDGPGGEVVWIPGVRRSDAATERSGGPVQAYVCERIAP